MHPFKKWLNFKRFLYISLKFLIALTRASAEKFPGGRGVNEKTRPKNSTIKPPSTLSVSSMKIQGGHGPPDDAHEHL